MWLGGRAQGLLVEGAWDHPQPHSHPLTHRGCPSFFSYGGCHHGAAKPERRPALQMGCKDTLGFDNLNGTLCNGPPYSTTTGVGYTNYRWSGGWCKGYGQRQPPSFSIWPLVDETDNDTPPLELSGGEGVSPPRHRTHAVHSTRKWRLEINALVQRHTPQAGYADQHVYADTPSRHITPCWGACWAFRWSESELLRRA